MNTPKLIQLLRDDAPVGQNLEAVNRLEQLYDRNVALVAALRESRDFIEALLDSSDPANLLMNSGENLTTTQNNVLHLDAFDVGDTVLAESADLGLSEYEGIIVAKKIDTNGAALFTVRDQEDNGNDHEAHEMRLVN